MSKFLDSQGVTDLTKQYDERYNKKLTPSSVDNGTPDKVLAFDSNGNLVKGAASGGLKLYQHALTFTLSSSYDCYIRTIVLNDSGYTISGGGNHLTGGTFTYYFITTNPNAYTSLYLENEVVLKCYNIYNNKTFNYFYRTSGSYACLFYTEYQSEKTTFSSYFFNRFISVTDVVTEL